MLVTIVKEFQAELHLPDDFTTMVLPTFSDFVKEMAQVRGLSRSIFSYMEADYFLPPKYQVSVPSKVYEAIYEDLDDDEDDDDIFMDEEDEELEENKPIEAVGKNGGQQVRYQEVMISARTSIFAFRRCC